MTKPSCRREFRSDQAYQNYLAFQDTTARLKEEVAQMREPSLTKREIHMKDAADFRAGAN